MLYFVVFQEEGVWVAHGLQKAVVAQGETLGNLRKNLLLTLQCFREDDSGTFDRLPTARVEYWEMFVDAIENGQNLDDLSDDDAPHEPYALKLAA